VSAATAVKPGTRAPEGPRGALIRLEGAGDSRLGGFAFVPESAGARVPLLVAIHGISRDAHEQARAFRPVAERRGWALLVPEFDETRHGDYQRLGRVGRGPRSDHALESLIDALRERASIEPGARLLVGFSAGAQFVHRYGMAHPDRVDAAVLGSPGWFTFPDPERAYPHGLRVGPELPGVRMSPRSFLRTPVLLTVGSQDTRRDPSLRQTRRVDRLQGRDRLERAARWCEAMNRLAERLELPHPVQLEILKGAGHDFDACCRAGLVALAERFFSERTAARAARNEPTAGALPAKEER